MKSGTNIKSKRNLALRAGLDPVLLDLALNEPTRTSRLIAYVALALSVFFQELPLIAQIVRIIHVVAITDDMFLSILIVAPLGNRLVVTVACQICALIR